MAVAVKKIEPQEMQSLIERVERAIEHDISLEAEDLQLLLDAIHTLFNVQSALENKDAPLLKLKKLLGMVRSSETRKKTSKRGRSDKNKKNKKATVSKPEVKHHEPEGHKAGDACPVCANGVLGKKSPLTSRRVEASQPYKVTLHILSRLEYGACGHVVCAALPEKARKDGDEQKVYGYSARSMMAIHKHFTGMPFFHQQNLNTLFGCPITASTICDQCEYVANDIRLAYQQSRYVAANALIFYIDDTHNRILDVTPKIKDKRNGKGKVERKGVYTSGLIVIMPDGKRIYLYETSVGHSGEHLDDILKLRDPDLPPPIIVCDALSANRPTVMPCIINLCNSHGKRQFYDTESYHPEVEQVLDDYGKIWVNNTKSKELGHAPEQRLAYHIEHSLPKMVRIKNWCQSYLASDTVEGAPLDNNLMESGLKLPIRTRKQSHFYKTEHGATVASILVSMIATAYQNGVNAFHYLNASLQRNKSKIKPERSDWLPWAVPVEELI